MSALDDDADEDFSSFGLSATPVAASAGNVVSSLDDDDSDDDFRCVAHSGTRSKRNTLWWR